MGWKPEKNKFNSLHPKFLIARRYGYKKLFFAKFIVRAKSLKLHQSSWKRKPTANSLAMIYIELPYLFRQLLTLFQGIVVETTQWIEEMGQSRPPKRSSHKNCLYHYVLAAGCPARWLLAFNGVWDYINDIHWPGRRTEILLDQEKSLRSVLSIATLPAFY